MNHDELFVQVKNEYARIASQASQLHTSRVTNEPTPEMLYEKRLNQVLQGIAAGSFDAFSSGAEIVAAVEQNPQRWLK